MPGKPFRFKLPIKNTGSAPVISVVQNDTNEFTIQLIDNGKPFDISRATLVTYTALKPDGTVVKDKTAKITNTADGILILTPDLQCVVMTGTVEMTVEIYEGTARMTSAIFYLEVTKDLSAGADPSSEQALPILERLVEDVSALEVQIGSAEAIRTTDEQQRKLSETARKNAENERATTEASRINSENARNNAENARVDNEDKRIIAEQGRVEAESNRVVAEKARTNIENERQAYETARVNAEANRATAFNTMLGAADSAIESAAMAAQNANTNAILAKQKADLANEAAENVVIKVNELEEAIDSANEAAQNADEKAALVEESVREVNNISANIQIAETARAEAEILRISAENERVIAETNRESSENTRKSNEADRINVEAERVEAENLRVEVESSRETAETSRESAEAERVAAEAYRINDENTRKSNESARQKAEESRELSESERAIAEDNRAASESIRVNNENSRETEETARGNAENNRESAEDIRANNENTRVSAEDSRKDAEQGRATAESNRATAETDRANAEGIRTSNEDTRHTNEAARQSERNAFKVWENYDAAKQYAALNKVTYIGSSYIALAPVKGVTPGIDPLKWQLIAQKGVDGEGAGDMIASVYDTDGDGKVNAADRADSVAWEGISDKPEAFPPSVHTHSEKADRSYVDAELAKKIGNEQKGAINGVAELDAAGKVPSSQLPSYVDDVLEFANQAAFPASGETGKIYVAIETNKTYRWSGSAYVEISASLSLGETSSTAYRGDRGKAAYEAMHAHPNKQDIDLVSGVNTGDETAETIGALINDAVAKETPADGDIIGFADSTTETKILKKLSWANIKASLKSYFDELYNKYTHPTGDGNLHVPATGTTNNGKVLKAGSSAGNLSWDTLTASEVGAETPEGAQAKVSDHANAADPHPQYALDTDLEEHKALDSSTSVKGHVQLTDSVTSTSAATAATPKNVKAAYDLANAAIPKSLATAANDFLVASAAGAWVKKTLTEVKTLLGLKSAAYTESSAYATAAQGTLATNAVPSTRTVNGRALSANISLTASDVGAALANPSIVAVSANKTLALTDATTVQNCTNASAITITIPTNASIAFPTGTEIAIIRSGAGDVSIAPASGVTLNSDGGKRRIKAQHTTAALKKMDTNLWTLCGNLAT